MQSPVGSGNSLPLSRPLLPIAKWRDSAMSLHHSVTSRCVQELRVPNKQGKQTTTTKTTKEPLKTNNQLGSSHSPWFPHSQLFSGKLLFFQMLLPVLYPPPCHLPPPGEAEVPEGQRGGQRSPLAWPGATRAASCQEPSVNCCPPQGNPNKVTSPLKSILPFKERLCLESKTYLWLDEDFIQPFTDMVRSKGGPPRPICYRLRGQTWLGS